MIIHPSHPIIFSFTQTPLDHQTFPGCFWHVNVSERPWPGTEDRGSGDLRFCIGDLQRQDGDLDGRRGRRSEEGAWRVGAWNRFFFSLEIVW